MKTSFLVAGIALAAFANSASANIIEDTTWFNEKGITSTADGTPSVLNGYGGGAVNKLDGTLDYVAWTQNFKFDSKVAKINSGTLALSLRDDGGLFDGIEIGLGIAESGQWDFGLVKTGTYKYDISLNSLLDGSFSVTLVSLIGDFFIDKSFLRIEYTPVSVPEPATLSLMGLGMLGAAFGYRRRKKKA